MDRIRVINSIEEFKEALCGELPVAFLQPGVSSVEGLEQIVLPILEDENIDAVYSDILVKTEQDCYPHIYQQFKPNMFSYHPIILSPIVIKPKKLKLDFDIEYLWTHVILKECGLFAHRIPSILFRAEISQEQTIQMKNDIIKINTNKHDKTINNNN